MVIVISVHIFLEKFSVPVKIILKEIVNAISTHLHSTAMCNRYFNASDYYSYIKM